MPSKEEIEKLKAAKEEKPKAPPAKVEEKKEAESDKATIAEYT